MHDFQHATAEATMDFKAEEYKIVFMKPTFPVKTLAQYDGMILKQLKTAGSEGRPTSSVVRTISE